MSQGPNDYQRLILWRLDSLSGDLERLEGKVETLIVDVAMLKVKAGAWGALAGTVPAAVAIVLSVVLGT